MPGSSLVLYKMQAYFLCVFSPLKFDFFTGNWIFREFCANLISEKSFLSNHFDGVTLFMPKAFLEAHLEQQFRQKVLSPKHCTIFEYFCMSKCLLILSYFIYFDQGRSYLGASSKLIHWPFWHYLKTIGLLLMSVHEAGYVYATGRCTLYRAFYVVRTFQDVFSYSTFWQIFLMTSKIETTQWTEHFWTLDGKLIQLYKYVDCRCLPSPEPFVFGKFTIKGFLPMLALHFFKNPPPNLYSLCT